MAKRDDLYQAVCARYNPEDLEEYVHQMKRQEAMEINNDGLEEQFKYLEEAVGLKWIEEILLEDGPRKAEER